MYRQLSSDMQEEYVSLLTVFENLEALYICRNVITVYPDCKSMIDVARQKLMNDPTFKHLSEDCQEYYFDFEAYQISWFVLDELCRQAYISLHNLLGTWQKKV